MTKSIKAITDVLTACGCDPVATTDANGDAIIKVNAPTVQGSDPALMDFSDPWTAFFEMD